MTVDLVPEWTIGDLLLTSYPFGVDADSTVDIGEPEMIVESVTSLLADGDLERVVRHGNRTYVLEVYVEGPSLGELAAAEALLRAELRRTGLVLTHNPGDGLTPTSAYEVQTAQLTPQRKDDHESHLIRKFTLTLTCAPFARSAEPVTVEALTSGSTTVVVDTCDSLAGWTGTRNGAPAPADGPFTGWEAGAVGIMEMSDPAGFPPEAWSLTRTGTVDFSSTRYLDVELTTLTAKGGGQLSVSAFLDASPVALPILQVRYLTDGSGYFRVTFDTSGATANSITFRHTSTPGYSHTWQGLLVRNIARTAISPNITARQMTRVINVGGTERTPASIHVSSADGVAPLKTAIVHTCPEDNSGYSPPLRRWRVSGQTVGAEPVVLISGQFESITGTGITYEIPTSALPEGGYVLAARLARSSVGTANIAWSTSTLPPGSSTGEGFVGGNESITFLNGQWNMVPITTLTLPSVRTKAGMVRIIIQAPDTGGPITSIDEAWLFRVGEDCGLTITNTPYAHLWLNSPGIDAPVPTIWTGDTAETRVHPGAGLQAMGTHVLSPSGTAVFTAALADTPATDATFYRRWHSNAAS